MNFFDNLADTAKKIRDLTQAERRMKEDLLRDEERIRQDFERKRLRLHEDFNFSGFKPSIAQVATAKQ